MLAGDEAFAVPLFVWASFLRLTTNRRVFAVPTPRADAFAFVDAVCAQALFLSLDPGPRHLALLRDLCDEADAVGDLLPDAVIGAVAVEYGCELVTLDRDFARFATGDRPGAEGGRRAGRVSGAQRLKLRSSRWNVR